MITQITSSACPQYIQYPSDVCNICAIFLFQAAPHSISECPKGQDIVAFPKPFFVMAFNMASNVKQKSCMLASRLSNEQLKFKRGEGLFRVRVAVKALHY
jgi:hypothetical protein